MRSLQRQTVSGIARNLRNLRGGRWIQSVALLALVLGVPACGTDEIQRQAAPLVPGANGAAGSGAWLWVYLSLDTCVPDGSPCPGYRLDIDNLPVLWDDGSGDYFPVGGMSGSGFTVPLGRHTFSLLDPSSGQKVVGTAAMDMADGMAYSLVFFGPPESLEQRWIVNDPSSVPVGMTHVRLLNALASQNAIQPVHCAGNLQTSPCDSLGPPVAHGEMFEIDNPSDTLASLGWRVSVPIAGGAVVAPMTTPSSGLAGSPYAPFTLYVPLHLQKASSECPSCIWANF